MVVTEGWKNSSSLAIMTFTQQARKRRIPLVCTVTAEAEPVPLKRGWSWPEGSHPCFTKPAPAQVNIQGKVTEDTGSKK